MSVIRDKQELAGKLYDTVLFAGTFDRLHEGHIKVINKAIELTERNLVICITSDKFVAERKKILYELIEPYEKREEAIKNFFSNHKDSKRISLECIVLNDIYGPIFEERIKLLLGSEETLDTCKAIQTKRFEKHGHTFDIFVVKLEPSKNDFNIDKISSSTKRIELLGTPKSDLKTKYDNKPLIISITGPICSGKSELCKIIKELANDAYSPPSKLLQALSEHFGPMIINPDGYVDRAALRKIVFNNSQELLYLTGLVVPIALNRKESLISELKEKYPNNPVIFVENALVFKQEPLHEYDEVWCCICSPETSITRLESERGIKKDEALKILSKNLSTKEFVDNSDVIFSNEFENSSIESQLDKSMSRLLTSLNWKE
ncbi:MAG: hypothetical protein MHPSP_003677 [Paramarteilia canceri]